MNAKSWAYDIANSIGDKANRQYGKQSKTGAFSGKLVSISPVQLSCMDDEIQLKEDDGILIITELLRQKLSEEKIGKEVLIVGDQIYYAIDFIGDE